MTLAEALLAPDPAGLNTRKAILREDLSLPPYQPAPAERENVRRKLAEAGIDQESTRIVLINPNSSELFALRRWSLGRFIELAGQLLREREDVSIVITGTAAERPDAEAILNQCRHPRCVSFAGRTTFPELPALYAEAHAMVTNDSGLAHFAALLELPTVVLFGPETPAL
jgi:ADP-heptose:LPS heptosyltransferase